MMPHTDLDEYKLIGIHLIALYVNSSSVTYFDGFGVEYMPKEIKTFIGNRDLTANMFRIQAYDSIVLDVFALNLLMLCFRVKAWEVLQILGGGGEGG